MDSVLGEKQEGLRLLKGIEEGTLIPADAYNIAKKRDPILLYFIFRYLREKYRPDDPAAAGVMERLIEITGTYAELVKAAREGEEDAMREWFDDAYQVADFRDDPDGYIDLIVEKLES